MPQADSPNFVYAVYDIDFTENAPGREIAFIEQRPALSKNSPQQSADEIYFQTLAEAKGFARKHYLFGAEYFSSKQLDDPDNLAYLLMDKLIYLIS